MFYSWQYKRLHRAAELKTCASGGGFSIFYFVEALPNHCSIYLYRCMENMTTLARKRLNVLTNVLDTFCFRACRCTLGSFRSEDGEGVEFFFFPNCILNAAFPIVGMIYNRECSAEKI